MSITVVWHPIPGVTGGTYDGNAAGGVLVLHTTEGRSIAAAEAAYAAKKVAPHYTVDLHSQTVAQHLPLSASASALKNLPGGVQTNRRGPNTIQVEIVGFASDSPNRSDDDLLFLGKFIRWICTNEAIPFDAAHVLPMRDRDEVPAHRLSPAAWLSFTGICGHQHIPENDHWDPGALDVLKAIRLATPIPTPEEETMRLIHPTAGPDSSNTYLVNGNQRFRVPNSSYLNALKSDLHLPVENVSQATWDCIRNVTVLVS